MAIRIFDQTVGQLAGITVPTTAKGAITNDGLEAYAQMMVSASGLGLTGDAAGEGNVLLLSGATISAAGTISYTANNQYVVIDTQGFENVALTVSNFGTGTVAVQWSNLTGSGFISGNVTNINTGATATSITADGQYTAASGGRYLRIATTAFTSGPLLVTPTFYAGGGSGGGGSSGSGATAAANGTVAVSAGTNKPLAVDLFSSLSVQVKDAAGVGIDWTAPVPLIGQNGTTIALAANPLPTDDVNYVAQSATTSGLSGALVMGAVTTSAPAYTTAQTNPLSLDVAGSLRVNATGNVADAATDSGNPVKIGGIYTSSLPTLTDGQRSNAHFGTRGSMSVQIYGADSVTPIGNIVNNADAVTVSSTGTSLAVSNFSRVFNGTSWDRQRGDTTAIFVQKGTSPGSRWAYAAAASGISNTTTAVTIAAAAGASTRNYVNGIQISTDALGAATEFAIRDGAGGTVLWRCKLQTAGLPLVNIVFESPLRGTANTLMEIVTLTASVTGAVYASVQGYTSAN